MAGAEDLQETEVDDNLRCETIVARRNVDRSAGLSCAIHIWAGLPAFDIRDDAIDDLTNILMRISDRPPGDIVVIGTGHFQRLS